MYTMKIYLILTVKLLVFIAVNANRIQIQQNMIKLQPSNEDFDIKGCTISGDKLLFTDKRNKRIIIHNGAGNHIEDISLSSEPFDIVALDDESVAVSFVLTLTGKLIKRIPVGSEFDQIEYITTHGKNVYFSVFIPKNIVSINLNGSVQWQFQKNIFNQPRGITSDIHGNIFVTGFASHNVVVVENNGRDCSELLNKGSGLHYPTSIYFDKTKERLLVSNLNDGFAYLYNIVYG
ncbi:unnamed protein product [Mytilus edulis]|uniref:Uncharacterized protein n=1 Tax=Mytilus edulis TaxID=6550 RepID=A0A8S3SDE7_MYTED|nr:unnamed protein product [Mytilus edulis]